MFGISLPELIVVLLAAFLLIGPTRLAGVSHELGRAIRKLKDLTQVFKNTRLSDVDTSALYQAQVELDKGLDELKARQPR